MPGAKVDAGLLFATTCRELCLARAGTKKPSTKRNGYKTFLKYARCILQQVGGPWPTLTSEGVLAFETAFKELQCESKATSLMVQRPHSTALVGGLKLGEMRKTGGSPGVLGGLFLDVIVMCRRVALS